MSNRYKLAILIGRFEPAHNGHFHNFANASTVADQLHILIGSSYLPRTIKNPFTANERREMIHNSLWEIPGNTLSEHRVGYSYIRDSRYNNLLWISEVQETIQKTYPNIADEDICILGYEKDDSSWYLHAFPKWKFIPTVPFIGNNKSPLGATKIRELLFEGNLTYIQGAVPPSMFEYLKKFTQTPEYEILVEEYNCIKDYKQSWSTAPYPPVFFTTDAVVIQGGHILLIKRKVAPGKGLWALPGGFIKPHETAIDGCLRELHEETRIKIPKIVLRKAITHQQLFDAPDRSLRGRTFTEAFLFELDGGDGKLAKVRASDDAKEADWFAISKAKEMSEELFEDHDSIIKIMTGKAK